MIGSILFAVGLIFIGRALRWCTASRYTIHHPGGGGERQAPPQAVERPSGNVIPFRRAS